MSVKALALLTVLLLFAGCLQAEPEAVEAAAIEPAPPAPLLSRTPRVIHVPAGDSYTVLWLNITEADWTRDGDRWGHVLGFDADDKAAIEGYLLQWGRVEDKTLSITGSHTGSGGIGSGGQGTTTDAPEARTHLVFLSILGAREPFDIKWDVHEDLLDFDIEGTPIDADIVGAGNVAHAASYIEFGSPFSAVFGSSGPRSFGFQVDDTRVQEPTRSTMFTGAGALALASDHAVEGPSLHRVSMVAWSTFGGRAGTWEAVSEVDGDAVTRGGVYAGPAMPWFTGVAAPHTSAKVALRLDAIAETFPLTFASAATVPFDAAALGIEVEEGYTDLGALPLVLQTPSGCLQPERLMAGEPDWSSCVSSWTSR